MTTNFEVPKKPVMTLDALPPELRAVIYDFLFANLSIRVTKDGKLDTSQYPDQISQVSQLLRNETLPLLRDLRGTAFLKLICEHGRFPEHIRRRLPTKILHAVRVITILDHVKHDELKPSLMTFPNLVRLEFDLYSLEQNDAAHIVIHFPWVISRNEVYRLQIDLIKLHQQQERPREGLEHDYLPENTLLQVCSKSKAKRGFDITAQLRIERVNVDSRDVENRYLVMALDVGEENFLWLTPWV